MEEHDVVVTRVFDAPLERVWRAWGDPADVRRWWGPAGFSCTLAQMDFRAGGTSLVCMRAPAEFGGGDLYNTWAYRTIVPMQRFEYVQKFTDQAGQALNPAEVGLPAGIPSEVLNVNVFRELTGRRTELTITEYGYGNPEVRDRSRSGLEQCLDKLAALVEQG
jgi:uncharacterized protein YndB with AHSA1/START domain